MTSSQSSTERNDMFCNHISFNFLMFSCTKNQALGVANKPSSILI